MTKSHSKNTKSKTTKKTSKKVQKAGSKKTKKTTSKKVVSKVASKTLSKTTTKKVQKAGSKTTQKAGSKTTQKAGSKKTQKAGSKKTQKAGSKTTPVKRKVRSFKVKLPGSETYLGRFTGLTPYQAANKALSKYYREESKPEKQIVFSIKESTRGSKRGTYAYNGRREKLKVPVEYTIQDGRVITKNFKNKLNKIKKAELSKMNLDL